MLSGSVSQASWSTDLQAQILIDDPIWISVLPQKAGRIPDAGKSKSASLRPAVPDDGDLMLSRTSSDGMPCP
jgi:hypothetical protein